MKKPVSERAKLRRVLLIWGACGLVGFGAGWLISALSDSENWNPAAFLDRLAPMLTVALCGVFAAFNVIVVFWSFRCIRQVAAQAKTLDPDNEAAYERLERVLSAPMSVTSVMQILDMAFYPVLIELAMRPTVSKEQAMAVFIVATVVFIASLPLFFAIGKKTVDIEKTLNPEKRGSLLDASFHKTWLNSCDEAQKQIIYESGFHAFRTGSNVCMVLWLVSVLLMFLLNTGVLPVLMVCAVWLAMQMTYLRAAARLEQGKH